MLAHYLKGKSDTRGETIFVESMLQYFHTRSFLFHKHNTKLDIYI